MIRLLKKSAVYMILYYVNSFKDFYDIRDTKNFARVSLSSFLSTDFRR